MEVNSEEKDLEQHLEQHLEQGLLLQHWINYEAQSTMTEDQSHMRQVQLDQLHATEERLGDERQGCQVQQTKDLLNQTPHDTKTKMNKYQDNNKNDDNIKEDCKHTAQERSKPM